VTQTLSDFGERWPSRLVATAAEDRLNISPTNPMPSRFWDPAHWRFRAEESRTIADQMIHEEARTIMRRIAMDYDRLAKLAEVQLIQEATERKT
jgi:hypothetical protein